MRVLVTGGAGFIGSHLIDRLVADGHEVRSIDCLEQQVHRGMKPDYLNSRCEYIWAEVGGEYADADNALAGVNVIFHMAALVGVGQSMTQPTRYVAQNSLSTAEFMEAVLAMNPKPMHVIVASSMSVYGEGRMDHAHPMPTDETWRVSPESVYALTKYDQEKLVMTLARSNGIACSACRFFNVYGARQALTNPYTGVCAIFASRLLKGQSPMVFEDGKQLRDFVHVADLVKGLMLTMERPLSNGEVMNLGSGRSVTIKRVADLLSEHITGGKIQPVITGERRSGDVRYCFADIGKARRLLGYEPQYTIEHGIPELVKWVNSQVV